VGDQRGVPLRQEADRRGDVLARQRRARQVEQLAPADVGEAPQRLQRGERRIELVEAQPREGGEVLARRRAEGGEVGADEGDGARARVGRSVRARIPANEGEAAVAPPAARRPRVDERKREAGVVEPVVLLRDAAAADR